MSEEAKITFPKELQEQMIKFLFKHQSPKRNKRKWRVNFCLKIQQMEVMKMKSKTTYSIPNHRISNIIKVFDVSKRVD